MNDQKILIRPNGDGNANYRSFVVFGGDSSGGEWDGYGFYAGRNAYGYGANFIIEYDITSVGTAWTHIKVGSGKAVFWYTNGNTIEYSGGGGWNGGDISSLVIMTTGSQTMGGEVTVFALNN